jgi:hypothetical protein
MEDGIENYKSSLSDRINTVCNNIEKDINNKIMYLYIPENSNNLFTNCIITDSKEKIINLSEKNKGQIICFVKDETTKLYKSIRME